MKKEIIERLDALRERRMKFVAHLENMKKWEPLIGENQTFAVQITNEHGELVYKQLLSYERVRNIFDERRNTALEHLAIIDMEIEEL